MSRSALPFKHVAEQSDAPGRALRYKHKSIIETQPSSDCSRELTHGLTHRRPRILPQAGLQLGLKEDVPSCGISDDEIVNIVVRLDREKSRPHEKAWHADIAEPDPAQDRLGESRADEASELRASLIR